MKTVRWLALGLFLVYGISSSGGLESSDAVLRYETARSWIDGRGGALPPQLGWDGGAVLPDGRVYCFFGPLQSVLMVPYVLAARALPAAADRSVVETFVISLGLFPLLSTCAMLLVFQSLRLLGHSDRTALAATLAVALGSLFWYYARMGQEESLVALGYALWLFGAARLAAGRRLPATLMAAGALVALATRWATVPQLAVLFVLTLVLLRRFRERVSLRDIALGAGVVAAGTFLLLLYNYVRFGDWLETGYGIWYAHYGYTMFSFDGLFEHAAALLVSPYRGLLFYSPVVLAAVAGTLALRSRTERLLGLGGLAVLAVALLFFASFRFWSGGHSWGPRFLTSPHVLLAPALAAFFARSARRAVLVPLLAAVQVFSTMLPASTEEYVWFNINRENPGSCDEWQFECTAIPQRFPRGLRAVANTIADRPGTTLAGRPIVPPEVVLSTSDYRTLYWWPVRIAFRLRLIPVQLALLVCLAGLGAGVAAVLRAWRAAPSASPGLPD